MRAGLHGRVLRAARERLLAGGHRRFVTSGYRALLDREPDPEGLAHYVHGLRSGTLTREAVIRHLAQSGEAARVELLRPGFVDHVRGFATAADDVPAAARPVCFLHIMKCAGTSLTTALSELADPWPRLLDVWADQLVCLPGPLLQRSMLTSGHLPYPVLDLLPPTTAAVTVLRDPVDRTLSHLAHLRTFGRRPDVTLEQFVGADEWRPSWVNYQARQLASDAPVGDAARGHFPAGATLQALVDRPWADGDAALDARARARLATIDVVGTVEDLDAVVGAVAAIWHKPQPAPVPRANEGLVRVRRAEVPESLLAEIRRHTAVDAALHAAALDGTL